jgi:hypothetical protein
MMLAFSSEERVSKKPVKPAFLLYPAAPNPIHPIFPILPNSNLFVRTRSSILFVIHNSTSFFIPHPSSLQSQSSIRAR